MKTNTERFFQSFICCCNSITDEWERLLNKHSLSRSKHILWLVNGRKRYVSIRLFHSFTCQLMSVLDELKSEKSFSHILIHFIHCYCDRGSNLSTTFSNVKSRMFSNYFSVSSFSYGSRIYHTVTFLIVTISSSAIISSPWLSSFTPVPIR